VTDYGQKGELRRRYREEEEDQLGAFGFLTNVCVTVYAARALDQIRAEGRLVAGADVAWLSPVGLDRLPVVGSRFLTALCLPAGRRYLCRSASLSRRCVTTVGGVVNEQEEVPCAPLG
jgi:hypothetical protein